MQLVTGRGLSAPTTAFTRIVEHCVMREWPIVKNDTLVFLAHTEPTSVVSLASLPGVSSRCTDSAKRSIVCCLTYHRVKRQSLSLDTKDLGILSSGFFWC